MTYVSEALRHLINQRAGSRCEYCHLHQDDAFFTHEVDHIYAERHGGATVETNLCCACAICNRNKGSDLCSLDPQTGEIVALFNPRRDRWEEHFRLDANGTLYPLTAQGRSTERLLHFNDLEIVIERARLIRLGRYSEMSQNPD